MRNDAMLGTNASPTEVREPWFIARVGMPRGAATRLAGTLIAGSLALFLGCGPESLGSDDDDSTATDDDDATIPTGDFDIDTLAAGRVEATVRLLAEAGVEVITMPSDAPPAFGEDYATPFDTVVEQADPAPYSNHVYSQLQAFSPDNRFVLIYAGDSPETVDLLVKTWPGREVAVPGATIAPMQAVRWLPNAERNLLVGYLDGAVTLVDVEAGTTESLMELPAAYGAVLTNQSLDDPSRDGLWFAGMALIEGTDDARIFTVDVDNAQIAAELSINALYDGPCAANLDRLDPDWTGVSPLGNYLVVQWVTGDPGRCSGLETFDIRTGVFAGRVTTAHPHGDLQVLADGSTEVFVTMELTAPGAGQSYVGGEPGGTALEDDYPAFAYRVLPGDPDTQAEPNYLVLTDWIFEHISCRGPFGWCLVTAANNDLNGAWDPLEEELFLLRLDGQGVVRLAHHRSDPTLQPSDDEYYWAQPRASFSSDGRYVLFDTNWGIAPATRSCVIDLAR